MKYKVLIGLDYNVKGKPVRREPGDVADDIPERSVDWLLRQNCIEEVPSVSAHAGEVGVGVEVFGGDD